MFRMNEESYKILGDEDDVKMWRSDSEPRVPSSRPDLKNGWRKAAIFLFIVLVVILILLAVAFVMIGNLESEARIATDSNVTEQKLVALVSKSAAQLRSEMNSSHEQLEISLNRTNDLVHKLMSGWYSASDGYIYKLFLSKVGYETAIQRCEILGGSILMKGLRNVTIFRELVANILLLDRAGCKTWIGYKYIENHWGWIDNGTTNPSVMQWNDGQPDKVGSKICATHISRLDSDTIARINDAECDYKCPYTCEIPTY